MKVVYIDNNHATGKAFCQAASELKDVECIAITDTRKSIVHFIESEDVPDYVFISCELADVPCGSLVEFIRKQEHLVESKIVVIADYFSKRDLKHYTALGVNHFLKSSVDSVELRKSLSALVLDTER